MNGIAAADRRERQQEASSARPATKAEHDDRPADAEAAAPAGRR